MDSMLIFSNTPAQALQQYLSSTDISGIWILADNNTDGIARMLRDKCPSLGQSGIITIPSGDDNKSLATTALVWQELSQAGATRHSLLINVGGGMVTDLGGFAAATFKRGLRFINIPTTLLGAVDAAVGGKTGVNFNGFKNEIGVFAKAAAVIISTKFFNTLPQGQFIAGYAEMLKHALLDSPTALDAALDFDLRQPCNADLLPLLKHSVGVKERIVKADPLERGMRKALNLGHTVAHAFESQAMESGCTVPHGHAVAWGIVTDLILSHLQLGFPSATLRRVAGFVERNYPVPPLSCDMYAHLIDLMRHDKKNRDTSHINFTLLAQPGQVKIDCTATPDEIMAALDIFRDLMHI